VFRLRFLRVLLPITLVVFLVGLAWMFQKPPTTHRESDPSDSEAKEQVTEVHYMDHKGLEAAAAVFQLLPDGRTHMEGIKELKLDRPGKQPLIISAVVGDIEGELGQRLMDFSDEVTIHDPDSDLRITLPSLKIDEAAGIARSEAGLVLEGAKLDGHAATLVYSLRGEPTELLDLVMNDGEIGKISCRRALLLDGFDDFELRGDVRVRREDERLDATGMRVKRRPDRTLRSVRAWEGVEGTLKLESGESVEVVARELLAGWDGRGLADQLDLTGKAELNSSSQSLAASSIRAKRDRQSDEWQVDAEGTVYLQGRVGGQSAWLRSETLTARLDGALNVLGATAEGQVRFDADATHAEADRAQLAREGVETTITLLGGERSRARLSRESTRVVADKIRTDPAGTRLQAEGQVEATLLPASGDDAPRGAPGIFDVEQAVHFVSASLDGRNAGELLTFKGNVRAWQGEQNLSGETVTLDQAARSLRARESVNTRFPRAPGIALAAADYVQISADELDYDDGSRRVDYRGTVRVQLDEGWLEAERVAVDLDPAGHGIRELRAFDAVRLEFRDPQEEGQPRMIAGEADRLIYQPAEGSVWLHGDKAPASVRRIGAGGGTTSGRVVLYRLASGTINVEAGGISTAGSNPP